MSNRRRPHKKQEVNIKLSRHVTLCISFIEQLVLEKGILSDVNVTIDDLQRIKVNTFSEILPILDKLIQRDLLRRLPSDRTAEYAATPLLLPPSNEEKEED
ncbi:MAG: hypothetical protein F6K23_23975 [Okeania sp. SIO2C9]|uniref:hypothetical protein n=1 Tax=Okeania sp. SIO2C9 TaxID=2607791 RepID=UPI0013C21FF7|nr:hypothetical protein [Okeania sp. SIO2C9]NEQ75826.1 hypothetical protein [Okeania sp. SIO2C9]